MKIKKICRAIILAAAVLTMGVMLSNDSYAVAAETAVEPRMTYISEYNADLAISSTGLATVTGKVQGKSGVTSQLSRGVYRVTMTCRANTETQTVTTSTQTY